MVSAATAPVDCVWETWQDWEVDSDFSGLEMGKMFDGGVLKRKTPWENMLLSMKDALSEEVSPSTNRDLVRFDGDSTVNEWKLVEINGI